MFFKPCRHASHRLHAPGLWRLLLPGNFVCVCVRVHAHVCVHVCVYVCVCFVITIYMKGTHNNQFNQFYNFSVTIYESTFSVNKVDEHGFRNTVRCEHLTNKLTVHYLKTRCS